MKTPTGRLRTPYYVTADGVDSFQHALNDHILRDDAELLERITELSEALDAVHKYMNENYDWD